MEMGLCKCPQRKVTNQFCYEHRVNVCQECMVSGHPRCVVQSYLNWLQDSDYDPRCTLCGGGLGSGGETVRLVCFHVFHWECLESHATGALPGAIVRCPRCEEPVVPKVNLVSPVADLLRRKLRSSSKWAGRTGPGWSPVHKPVSNDDRATPLADWSSHHRLVDPPPSLRQKDVFPKNLQESSSTATVTPLPQPRRPLLLTVSQDEDKYTRRPPKARRLLPVRKLCRFVSVTLLLTAFVVALYIVTKTNNRQNHLEPQPDDYIQFNVNLRDGDVYHH